MTTPRHVHLFFYTDSIGFPRRDVQPLQETFPWLVKDILENKLNVKVYLYHRGMGGASVADVYRILNTDSGYFCFSSNTDKQLAFRIFNVGIVDAAPRPFTYYFKEIIQSIPILGPVVWRSVHKYRPFLQSIYSYQLTPLRQFRRVYGRMVRESIRDGFSVLSMMTPLPPVHQELRSKGYRAAVNEYNNAKRGFAGFIEVEEDEGDLLLEDGHHLTLLGHERYAELIVGAMLDTGKFIGFEKAL